VLLGWGATGCNGDDGDAEKKVQAAAVRAFCRQMTAAADDFSALERRAFTDPARIRPVLDRMRAIEKVAPAEVDDEARQLVADLEEILLFVESAGQEPKPGRFDFERFRAALQRLVRYEETACSVPTTGG